MNALELTKKLIEFKSITPEDAGSLDFIKSILDSLGFNVNIITFKQEGEKDVKNLYAKIGNGKKTLCFAGHVDVVPVGDLKAWKSDPFTPTLENNTLYGRGAVDMKSGLACFISAIANYIKTNFNKENDSILLLITAGEEGVYVNGTYKLVRHVVEKENISIDATIVAEPSSQKIVGDSIKIGRRGSMNFKVIANGKQGHVAYHKMALNPAYSFIPFLNELSNLNLDNGNENFESSNLEIVAFESSSSAYNVIPKTLEAKVNIRFNNNHTSSSLGALIQEIANKYSGIEIQHILPHTEPFLVESNSDFVQIVKNAIIKTVGVKPEFSTSGGTSDAAYIKDFSKVLEFGLPSISLHEVNERANIEDIEKLSKIYEEILNSYFKK